MEEVKTLKEFKKAMGTKAEEAFEEICQIDPKAKSLLNIDIVKEAMLTIWVCGLHEGVRQAKMEIDKYKEKEGK